MQHTLDLFIPERRLETAFKPFLSKVLITENDDSLDVITIPR